MTSEFHKSGSDRISEVASRIEGDPIIVNVQGDEPLISPKVIDSAVEALLSDPDADISTTSEVITDPDEVLSPDVVKVVRDASGYAIYFSRSPIPFPREAARRHGGLARALSAEPSILQQFRKHTGLYVFRRSSLMRYTALGPTQLEEMEMLEQLRALENGMKIKVVEVAERSLGIDTESDLAKLRSHLEAMGSGVPSV
jgi:3-deoxy-manno-octulosonate cytidylyltransferase (CMP-KDO synthetase)